MENCAKLVSIVVPVYNVEKYIDRCLTSILEQDYTNWELILIDDGSADSSGAICDRYAEKDQRIRVLHTENKGVSSARNLGIEQIRGEYAIIVDSDDWMDNKMISTMVSALEERDLDIVACDVNIFLLGDDGSAQMISERKWGNLANDQNLEMEDLYFYFVTRSSAMWNKMVRSSIVKQERFDTGFHFMEDLDFLIRILKHCKKGTLIPYIGYNYFRGRPGNTVGASVNPYHLEAASNCSKVFEMLKDLNQTSLGVDKIVQTSLFILRSIPIDDYSNACYREYYAAVRKAVRYPGIRDTVCFMKDRRLKRSFKIKYLLMRLDPRIVPCSRWIRKCLNIKLT